MNDTVRLAMEQAALHFGGEGTFNACGFSRALVRIAGLSGVQLDGQLVRVILHGRTDVEQMSGGSHYKILERLDVDEEVVAETNWRWAVEEKLGLRDVSAMRAVESIGDIGKQVEEARRVARRLLPGVNYLDHPKMLALRNEHPWLEAK